MKVSMFGPFSKEVNSGVSNHVHYLSLGLEKLGVEVERISWKDGGDKKVSLADIPGEMTKGNSDINHLHSTAILSLNIINTRNKFSKKNVNTIHSFFHSEYEYSVRMKIVSQLLKYPYIRALKRTENNIAVSTFTKEEASKRGVNVRKIIGNGVPISEFKGVRYDSEFGSDVLFVGRFTRQKGIFDFINAFKNRKIKGLVIGHGDKQIEKTVEKKCKTGGIGFFKNLSREKLLKAYKSCKVFALPSIYEPFGITGIEALASGKPVIAYSKAGGPNDYVKNGENGFIIGSDPNKLRKTAEEIIDDKKKLVELSKEAIRSSEKYDWKEISKKVKEFYSEISNN